jgi:hypothetical protein
VRVTIYQPSTYPYPYARVDGYDGGFDGKFYLFSKSRVSVIIELEAEAVAQHGMETSPSIY